MDDDLVPVLHVLRDKYPGTLSEIAEIIDLNEEYLEGFMKEAGVPDERYDAGPDE